MEGINFYYHIEIWLGNSNIAIEHIMTNSLKVMDGDLLEVLKRQWHNKHDFGWIFVIGAI